MSRPPNRRRRPPHVHPGPGPAAVTGPAPTGNLDYDEALYQLDPTERARIEAYAASIGQSLNWDLPLEFRTVHAFELDATNPNAPNARGPVFNLIMPFDTASYVRRVTCTVRGMVLNSSATQPSALFQNSYGVKMEDYVYAGWRRNTGVNITHGRESDLLPMSMWMGDGQSPFELGLTQFFWKGDQAVIQCQLAEEVDSATYVGVALHYLALPLGLAVRDN